MKSDRKSDTGNILTVSGVHLSTNMIEKDLIISLDDATPDDHMIMSAIIFDTNDGNTRCYLPVVVNDRKDKSELILLSIGEPHI